MHYVDVCKASDCFFDEDALDEALEARGHGPLPRADDLTRRFEIGSEVALDELLERLEPHLASADIYLPIAFTKPFQIRAVRFASLTKLRSALEMLRDELELDLPADSRSKNLARQRNLWRTFNAAAKEAKAHRLCVAILRDL